MAIDKTPFVPNPGTLHDHIWGVNKENGGGVDYSNLIPALELLTGVAYTQLTPDDEGIIVTNSAAFYCFEPITGVLPTSNGTFGIVVLSTDYIEWAEEREPDFVVPEILPNGKNIYLVEGIYDPETAATGLYAICMLAF